MSQILEKRTADNRWYNIDCSQLLGVGETITSVGTITADQGGMTFGAGIVNTVPVTDPKTGLTAPIGQVVQVQISGGTVPSGVQYLDCFVRAPLTTSVNPLVEATVTCRLTNNPNY